MQWHWCDDTVKDDIVSFASSAPRVWVYQVLFSDDSDPSVCCAFGVIDLSPTVQNNVCALTSITVSRKTPYVEMNRASKVTSFCDVAVFDNV
jgi:hypothetical protein